MELELFLKDDEFCFFDFYVIWFSMVVCVGLMIDNCVGGWYFYCVFKVGVILFSKFLDRYFVVRSGDKVLVMVYYFGMVKMGLSKGFWDSVEEGKLFSMEYVVEKMVGVVVGFEVG